MRLKELEEIIKNRKKTSVGNCIFFSVLIPIIDIEGELHILYEVRADNLKRQPGEISFPGGVVEKGETPFEAAIRETEEELNLNRDDIEVIGEFDTLYGATNFVMYTFVGIISKEAYENMKPSKGEVKDTFLVPISYLMENEPEISTFIATSKPEKKFNYELVNFKMGYSWAKTKIEVPIYTYDKHAIWGITGRVTYDFIKVLRRNKK